MPLIWIETAPSVWEHRNVSYEERRRLLLSSDVLQRWMQGDELYITLAPEAASAEGKIPVENT